MVSNLLESSALVQVVQVVQGCGVPAVPAGGTGSYVIGPVPTYRPNPCHRPLYQPTLYHLDERANTSDHG